MLRTTPDNILQSANLTPFQLQYLTALRDRSGRWKQCTKALKLITVEDGVTTTRHCVTGVAYELLSLSTDINVGFWSYPTIAEPDHLNTTKYSWATGKYLFNGMSEQLAARLGLTGGDAACIFSLNDFHRVSFVAFAKLFERYWSGETDIFKSLLAQKELDAAIRKSTKPTKRKVTGSKA